MSGYRIRYPQPLTITAPLTFEVVSAPENALHANDALSGLTRLESLISRNTAAPKEIMPLIAEAVDMVVHITRTASGRKIQQIIEVQGFKRGNYQIKKL